ncbi:unnamed protein product [Rotaria sp. Silwood2]|nr:unnamed protein product [Rotaria sp. Silwood2]CAF2745164.1 unnamed protein product [Rotaria sp. Silwood2]CAF3105045.1 unnamed protein product [Rotaria sp. Silwood2]CAF3257178.1 unnamed protein product [Rotaria sp. Silwood2]CAF3917311.1 unnamed protein product [Rotaria sp. Silwood2]
MHSQADPQYGSGWHLCVTVGEQAPLLIYPEYRIELPDYDFVVAEQHKLIPSVYGALIFKNKHLSYSGPTFISIRSDNHDHSTAFTHLADLSKCLSLDEFKQYSYTDNNETKPIFIVFTDGRPDENPSFNVLFVAIKAPGHSAFNPIERRMAPLSHDLSGLILPHDYYGKHLNDDGKTINIALEQQNFQRAGERLPSPELESDDELLVVPQELQSSDEIVVSNELNKSAENDSGVELIADYASWAASYF